MPKLKLNTPAPLEDLCLSAVVRCLETDLVLCEIAKCLAPSSLLLRRVDLGMVQIAKELSDYMAFLPGTLSEMVRQKITTRVIKNYTSTVHSIKTLSRFTCLTIHTMTLKLLEITLNEDVHSFDLSEFDPSSCIDSLRPSEGEPKLWELLLDRCTGLRRLSFPSSLNKCFATDISSFIEKLVPQCNQLTEVILKDAIQDGKVLSVLGANCPNLRILDITGSSIVCTDVLYLIFPTLTEAEVVSNYSVKSKKGDLLPNLPTGFSRSLLCTKMRELIVSNTKMRSLGIYYALKYLPNLETLGVCYHIEKGIKKHWQEGSYIFNLKHVYILNSTKEKINLVCSACPKLETLYIGSGDSHPFLFKFLSLSKVPTLKSLTLESTSGLDLSGLSYASQLTELKLQVPDVDVGHIAEACPLLIRLIITKEPKRIFTLSPDRLAKQRLFGHLQEIQVDSQISARVASLIITEAVFLRVVKIVRVKKLSDQILASWLDINPLLFLETWLLTYAHLTVESVTLLLTRCPNLSTLGRLSGWDVRSWESRRLQRTWQSYDLNLVLFSHKQEDIAQIMDATASSDEEPE